MNLEDEIKTAEDYHKIYLEDLEKCLKRITDLKTLTQPTMNELYSDFEKFFNIIKNRKKESCLDVKKGFYLSYFQKEIIQNYVKNVKNIEIIIYP